MRRRPGEGYARNVSVGAADGAFVGLMDVYPTLAELLGLDAVVPQGQLKGQSLVPFLKLGGRAPTAARGGGGGNFEAAFTQIVRSNGQGAGSCVNPDEDLTPDILDAASDKPAAKFSSRAAALGLVANCTMGLSVRVKDWRCVTRGA